MPGLEAYSFHDEVWEGFDGSSLKRVVVVAGTLVVAVHVVVVAVVGDMVVHTVVDVVVAVVCVVVVNKVVHAAVVAGCVVVAAVAAVHTLVAQNEQVVGTIRG